MDISLIHAGLAAGAALAAVPVLLHLFMKQQPKHVVFPALRLIRERQKRSRKRLRIKNWLLLLARMALVALMALALARPRLFSQTALGDREVPTALGLVFDTSLSMGYKEREKTRLDEAKQRAFDLLKTMPDSSQVFVIDSAEPGVPVPLSPAAARARIEGLALRAAGRPLNAAVGQAYAAVAACDMPRHEVYILTDLARSAWDTSRTVEGLDAIKELKAKVVTYVLRLAPEELTDIAVVEAKPSASVATQGEAVEIRALVRARGPAVKRVAEFRLDGVKKEQKDVAVPADGEAEVKFLTPKLGPAAPLHQGEVKISGTPDPLAFDDIRYFSFKVQPARRVLIASDLAIDAEFVADALDPSPESLPPGAPRPFHVERIKAAEFATKARDRLKDLTCVVLNNVKELSDPDWGRLSAYVHEGGGLVIGLGDHCEPGHYNGPTAAQLVPGALGTAEGPAAPTTFGKINDATHPLFSRYPKELDAVLSQVPISHYWRVATPQGARTLLTYADGAPALVERTFKGPKAGHVLLWTTPLSRRADPRSRAAWNEFPIVGWSFFYLMNQTVPYLAGTSGEPLIYEAGQDVVLPLDPTHRYRNYIVQGPDQKTSDRLSPAPASDSLLIVAPQPIGQWTVSASGPEGTGTTLGFSVNPPLAETQLTALGAGDLDALFGKDNYKLATDAESLRRATEQARIGHEIFPWLMFLILILVTAENLLANTFYREGAPKAAVGAPA
ncbi:MAG TPA: BatA domain-containing protein [Isosphaeraceae bacterium]|nr:BatA domain-containing protein [Isosphaeraceae bacterium]